MKEASNWPLEKTTLKKSSFISVKDEFFRSYKQVM